MKEYESLTQSMNEQIQKKTVSLPKELLEKGTEQAKKDNRTFSGYIQQLIRRDLDGTMPVSAAGAAQEKTAKAA